MFSSTLVCRVGVTWVLIFPATMSRSKRPKFVFFCFRNETDKFKVFFWYLEEEEGLFILWRRCVDQNNLIRVRWRRLRGSWGRFRL